MKVKVNEDACIGCGMCAGLCPTVFELNDEGKAQVIVDEVSADDESSVSEAAASCPVEAIEN